MVPMAVSFTNCSSMKPDDSAQAPALCMRQPRASCHMVLSSDAIRRAISLSWLRSPKGCSSNSPQRALGNNSATPHLSQKFVEEMNLSDVVSGCISSLFEPDSVTLAVPHLRKSGSPDSRSIRFILYCGSLPKAPDRQQP